MCFSVQILLRKGLCVWGNKSFSISVSAGAWKAEQYYTENGSCRDLGVKPATSAVTGASALRRLNGNPETMNTVFIGLTGKLISSSRTLSPTTYNSKRSQVSPKASGGGTLGACVCVFVDTWQKSWWLSSDTSSKQQHSDCVCCCNCRTNRSRHETRSWPVWYERS